MTNNEFESEVTISYSNDDDNYDQLLDSFNEMHQAQNLAIANNLLKDKLKRHVDKLVKIQKELSSEKAKNDILEKDKNNSSCNYINTTNVTSPCEGCKVLEVKVEYLLKALSNFTMGKENLEALLAQQKCAIEKAGLGYAHNKKQKIYKKFFKFTQSSLTHPSWYVIIVWIRDILLLGVW